MKILYAAGRYSPLNHDEGSGTDYCLYHALKGQGAEIDFVGPFDDTPSAFEKVYRKFHRLLSKRRPAKYTAAMLRRGSRALTDKIKTYQPDIVFSKNLSSLVLLKTDRPIVYMLDDAVVDMNRQWPTFSKFEAWRMIQWEKKVVAKASYIITRSDTTADVLVKEYGFPREKIEIVYNSCSLPERVVPQKVDFSKPDFSELRLLLVGREYKRKGIDIAIEVVRLLNEQQIPTKLHIVGMTGESTDQVIYIGKFKKSDETQLKEYASQYYWPHFLIHPARYDAAPIVTTEAAAFGIPSLSDNVGGIGSTVKDKISGIVLPALSPAEEYVKVIKYYMEHPDEYVTLRRSARVRYEKELNWPAAGKHILAFLSQKFEKKEAN